MNEITIDESMLNQISGGSNGQVGMNCPVCKTFVSTTIDQIEVGGSIKCPGCGTVFKINFVPSKIPMDILHRLERESHK